jgi:hypothetical protein
MLDHTSYGLMWHVPLAQVCIVNETLVIKLNCEKKILNFKLIPMTKLFKTQSLSHLRIKNYEIASKKS